MGHAWNQLCQFLQRVRELAWGVKLSFTVFGGLSSPVQDTQNLPACCVPIWRLTALSQPTSPHTSVSQSLL